MITNVEKIEARVNEWAVSVTAKNGIDTESQYLYCDSEKHADRLKDFLLKNMVAPVLYDINLCPPKLTYAQLIEIADRYKVLFYDGKKVAAELEKEMD